ncbi:Holliday junction branch migration protein RuvA [Amphibacillus jilinensis]|uniref:Holliday junction branch migration protein RuvA n=1 Tax=Amphibacillus jilinensis TaxID=1216008 RepID=UPI0002EA4849|nr:Holliday junction branch migration protein RuvA [Amphibacillus jilinensis]
MIAYIHGTLVEMTELAAIVDVNGVGYEIFCANPFHFQEYMSQKIKIHTYHHVREDAQILYGFRNTDEKQLFSQILNVSGIGPKGALSIVGNASVEQFVLAIEEEDEKFLTQFPGVGKKTARQMILDLKGKLPFVIQQTEDTQQENEAVVKFDSESVNEAVEALKALGYKEREIKAVMPQLKQAKLSNTDALIRKALALMMQ